MKLVDKVSKLFKDHGFSIVEVGVIATRLGIEEKKEEIHKRHFESMFDELVDEIDKAMPKGSKAQLLAVSEYIKERKSYDILRRMDKKEVKHEKHLEVPT